MTLCGKTNVLTYAFDLWERTFYEVAKEFKGIETDYAHVDAICMWMVKNPEWFDVIVTDNMFGDIITDLGAMIQGGLGIAAGGNINPHGVSMFEPIGGTAPKYTGMGVVSPLAAISACQMMLEHLGEEKAARGIEEAIMKVVKKDVKSLSAGKMGYTTSQVGDLVVRYILGKIKADFPSAFGPLPRGEDGRSRVRSGDGGRIMEWGMKNRLSQLIKSDGHCLSCPLIMDIFRDPLERLEKPGETIRPLLPYCDALFVTRGVLRASIDPENTKPIILRVSGGTSMVGKDLSDEGITTSMEEAIRLNAAAVGISIFVGSDYEHESLLNLSNLVDEGEKYGIPVMAVTAVGKELEKRDARYLALSSRIAAELGARIVKTYWCETLKKWSMVVPFPWSWQVALRWRRILRYSSLSMMEWRKVPSE